MKIKNLNCQLLVALMLLISAACANDPSASTNSAAEKSDPVPVSAPDTSAKTDTQHPQDGIAANTPDNTQPADNASKPDIQTTGTSTTTTGLNATGAKKMYKVLNFNGLPKYKNALVEIGEAIEDMLKISFSQTTDFLLLKEDGNNSSFIVHPLPFEQDPANAKPCNDCKLAVSEGPIISSTKMGKIPNVLSEGLRPGAGLNHKLDTKILLPDGRIKMYEYKRPGASLVTPGNTASTSVNLSEIKRLNTTETATFKKTPTLQVTPAETRQVSPIEIQQTPSVETRQAPLRIQSPIKKQMARPNGG